MAAPIAIGAVDGQITIAQMATPIVIGAVEGQMTIAQMAESVDALVSNTCGCKAVPVRPRLWVQSPDE
jgi:hypothetical protein